MGADGHILIVDSKKAEQLFGKNNWAWLKENAPTCVYDRQINKLEVTTFYWGDNMVDSFWDKDDWFSYSTMSIEEKLEAKNKVEMFLSKISQCEIDSWEVWT